MKIQKLTVEEVIKKFSNENGFSWGINTAMKSLVPKASYDLTCRNNTFEIDRWESEYEQPTSDEIKKEYERQELIAEVIDYFKKNKIKSIFYILKK